MNKTQLVGRLCKDPELKFTNGTGTAVSTFTLAVNRRFKNQEGKYDADFISIVAWKGTAEFIANYFKKGDVIGVSGRIQTRNYKAQDGNNKFVTEVVAEEAEFVGSKKDAEPHSNVNGYTQDELPEGYVPDDEDIPF